jgi:hypothetical protein
MNSASHEYFLIYKQTSQSPSRDNQIIFTSISRSKFEKIFDLLINYKVLVIELRFLEKIGQKLVNQKTKKL